MKRVWFLFSVLFLAGLPITLAQPQPPLDNLIMNGDFADGLEHWSIESSCCEITAWMNARSDAALGGAILQWERQQSHNSGSAIFARQSLNVNVSHYSSLILGLDVRVDFHTLLNSGWWSDANNGSGEYPVKIVMTFLDEHEKPFEWSWGFLAEHDGTTALTNYKLVALGEWTNFQTDIFAPQQWVDPRGAALPTPLMLVDFRIGGNGWDFGGAAANIKLHPIVSQTLPPSDLDDALEGARLLVEEYPLVAADVDSPDHFEFRQHLVPALLETRRAWREPQAEQVIAYPNAVMAPFGYRLVVHAQGETGATLALYHDDSLLLSDIDYLYPIAVSPSGNFRLLLSSMSEGVLVVTPDTVGAVDSTTFIYIPPVFVGEEVLRVEADWEHNQFTLWRGEALIYTYTPSEPYIEPPVKGLWSWQGQWVLEVKGDVIINGASLREQVGADEVFGWRLIAGQPFYFFRQGDQIGMSYAASVLPYRYSDVVRDQCCEASMFNLAGNEHMVWFYALRDGIWHYVEAGIYDAS